MKQPPIFAKKNLPGGFSYTEEEVEEMLAAIRASSVAMRPITVWSSDEPYVASPKAAGFWEGVVPKK